MDAQLKRSIFKTSILLNFCSEKELIAQTGHHPEEWLLVILKELFDNALDPCEEAGVAPEITVDKTGITIADNGTGIKAQTVKTILDFSIRGSSREVYVSPTRGALRRRTMTLHSRSLAVVVVRTDKCENAIIWRSPRDGRPA
jgi:DNA topoisomerase VI subunit B